MARFPHRIRHLRWKVQASSAPQAFSFRKFLRDTGPDQIVSVFEKAFDCVGHGEQVVYIPKMEVHLCVPSEEALLEQLPGLIEAQLLKQRMYTASPQSALGVLREPDQGVPRSGESSSQHGRFDILLHYLRTGFLPWFVTDVDQPTMTARLRETCCNQWDDLLVVLRDGKAHTPFYFRLLQILSTEESVSLMNALLNPASEVWQTAGQQIMTFVLNAGPSVGRYSSLKLMAAFLSEGVQDAWRDAMPDLRHFAEGVLAPHERQALLFFLDREASRESVRSEPILSENSSADSDPVPGRFSPPLTPQGDFLMPVGDALPSRTGDDPVSDRVVSRVAPQGDSLMPVEDAPPSRTGGDPVSDRVAFPIAPQGDFLVPVEDALPSRTGGDAVSDRVASRIAPQGDFLMPVEDPLRSRTGSDYAPRDFTSPIEPHLHALMPVKDPFPLMVHHAGLILLCPFILRFFERTGVLTENRSQVTPFMTARAAALLHFLATGREAIYEYELGCIKILLGLSPTDPLLVAEGTLQPSDREEADDLLRSVIGYWSVLKNTSVAGLRESFLQRQGLLREEKEGWRLFIERKPFDLLLDRLPWGIQITKLPWMQRALYTEW